MTTYLSSPPYASSSNSSRDSIPRYSQLRHEGISTGVSPVDVPSAVSTLLASTRSLEKTLELWSRRKASDDDVSDVFVEIGHEFNATINAFGHYGIDLSDIHCIPSELRTVLEQCLAEDPSPAILQRFLPDLRKVLVKLLKGLQCRQSIWRAAVRLNG
ncbi:hypothetical protein D9619_006644 [Psilocybe cf. subviscida]|uniref:Aip3p/Bud6 N-terminal domain-containing protein n=1 Tax=Psilocybe cf. subviscida TaxID=2480587 RepID=A0A8H5B461_9AGAR|nr:hypothetical protein D9619_006644 [Psilocybe cf. subviscida]